MTAISHGKCLNSEASFDINMMHYQTMEEFHNTFWNFLSIQESEKHPSDLVLIKPHI